MGLGVAVFVAGSSIHAKAQDLKATLDEIRQLLKPADSDSPETKQLKESLQRVPDQWKLFIDQGQFNRISEYGIQSMSGSWAKIPGLSEKIQELGRSLAEEAARSDAAKIAEADALIAKVAETLKNAKKAEELDGLLLSISKNQIAEYGNNPRLQSASRELQAAMQIVDNWQEYLIAEETGNHQSRRNQLEQISSQLARTPIIPRSLVLRLLNQPGHPTSESVLRGAAEKPISYDAIRSRLTESGDTAAALAEIKATVGKPSGNSEDSTFEGYVKMIEDLRMMEPSMSESEVFANIRNIQNSLPQRRLVFNRAIEQIALNAIARNYRMEKPSSAATSSRNVLEGIATAAVAKKDWGTLRKAINSLDALAIGSSNPDSQKRSNDLKILSHLEVAEAAAERRDIETAAIAYLEASLIDGQYLQRKTAYAKIGDLKQRFPEQVAKATEMHQQAEAARNRADLETRVRMMRRPEPMQDRQREDLAALRPMVQEIVAEFLKGRRLEELSSDKANTPEEPKKR